MNSIRAEGGSVCTSESDCKAGNGYQRTGVCFLRKPRVCHFADESGFEISGGCILRTHGKRGDTERSSAGEKTPFCKTSFWKRK